MQLRAIVAKLISDFAGCGSTLPSIATVICCEVVPSPKVCGRVR